MKKQAQQQQEAAARAAMQKKLQDQESHSSNKSRDQEDKPDTKETEKDQKFKESKIEQNADDDNEDGEEVVSDGEASEKSSETADQEDEEQEGQEEQESQEEAQDEEAQDEEVQDEENQDEDQEEVSDDSEESEESEDEENYEELFKQMVGKKLNKSGMVVDKKSGAVLGRLVEGKVKKLAGKKIGENGTITNDKGKVVGKVEPVLQDDNESDSSDDDSNDNTNDAKQKSQEVDDTSDSKNEKDSSKPTEEDDKKPEKDADEDQKATKEEIPDASKEEKEENLPNEKEDIEKKDKAKEEDAEEKEEAERDAEKKDKAKEEDTKKEDETQEEDNEKKDKAKEDEKPFNPNDAVNEDSPEVRKSGKIVDMEDNVVGTIDKEKAAKFAGLKVDKEGNVINEDGHTVAKADLYPDEEENKPFNPNDAVNEDSPEVRKSGKIVDMEDNVIGTIDKEKAAKFAGLKVDKEGNVIDKEGHIVARANLYPDEEENKPFNPNDMVNEDSPEVRKSGKVFDMDDNLVGYVDKRIAAKVAGFKVDDQGNVINPEGHVVARAEMIKQEQEEDEEPEEEEKDKPFNPNDAVDENSPEVRKSGKVFDMDDNLVGHVDKRLAAKFAGFKVDEEGNIINHDGHVVGRAEMIPKEEEKKEDKQFNPYAMVDENSPEVKKSGKVVDMDDNIVGHVDKRVAHKLAGFKVDEEGNVINNEGLIAGKAQMLPKEEENKEKEEEKKDKPFNPNTMVDEHSPRVRKSGKVVDEDDEIVGTVDKSAAHKMAGFPVDYDGNIIDPEGHIVGKAQMIKKEEKDDKKDEKSDADKEEEEYRKIADQMSTSIQQSLDKIKPVLKRITETIDEEESKPQKERDEQKLVDTVKPLIEQGSQILEEANGAIRGLDPTGRIAKKAQSNTSNRKASPEEYHLADLLAQLSGEVTTTIDRAKKKVRNMPHAKKELSPLWNILQSPLLQILSAVGLLLTGVLGLVGNILNGLGLGSIVNSLLGGIGLNKILEGFGLGDALKLGGKK
ncbi:hypothetical protein BD560DRAFT_443237 [Blakeslea trispora]|nr:hypothetical protein BD560DRAFT_443237 [Blakeslea trispora]